MGPAVRPGPDGTPVAGARVEVRGLAASGSPLDGATTDADGRFELSGVPPGRHLLAVERGPSIREQGDEDPDDVFEVSRDGVGVEVRDDPLLGAFDEAELPGGPF